MTSPQQQVAQLVADRGYREGWTLGQFAARNVAKLQEELAELAECFNSNNNLFWEGTFLAGQLAKVDFDNGSWDGCRLSPLLYDAAMEELADIQVVVFTLAQALSELSDEPFDVVQAALDKAGRDVERGIRKDG